MTQLLLLPLVAAVLTTEAQAQGNGKGRDDKQGPVAVVQQGHTKRPKGKKVHTSDEAVEITRVVLREQGYELVRVEQRGDVRVVYYRRGNMGRGRGKGPIMYMIVRPSPERIVIERAPSSVLVQINVRLGY
jgi:uncharacterized protein (UPF0548 family)